LCGPVIYECFADEHNNSIIAFFAITSLTSIILFFCVAMRNPGFIQGSKTDVTRRAGAYNPKHYQIESERKANENREAEEVAQSNHAR
jgi:hypothetical protein